VRFEPMNPAPPVMMNLGLVEVIVRYVLVSLFCHSEQSRGNPWLNGEVISRDVSTSLEMTAGTQWS